MIFDKNGLVQNKKYWNVYDFNKYEIKSQNQYVNDVYELINDSVKSHLVSDVPFGCFLSLTTILLWIYNIISYFYGLEKNIFSF